MNDLEKFAAEVEKAFILVGGEQSKATYDWMITKQAEERIIKLLEKCLSTYKTILGENNNFVAGYGSAIEHIKGENK